MNSLQHYALRCTAIKYITLLVLHDTALAAAQYHTMACLHCPSRPTLPYHPYHIITDPCVPRRTHPWQFIHFHILKKFKNIRISNKWYNPPLYLVTIFIYSNQLLSINLSNTRSRKKQYLFPLLLNKRNHNNLNLSYIMNIHFANTRPAISMHLMDVLLFVM